MDEFNDRYPGSRNTHNIANNFGAKSSQLFGNIIASFFLFFPWNTDGFHTFVSLFRLLETWKKIEITIENLVHGYSLSYVIFSEKAQFFF